MLDRFASEDLVYLSKKNGHNNKLIHYYHTFLLAYTAVIPTITNTITIISIIMKIVTTLTTTGIIIFEDDTRK